MTPLSHKARAATGGNRELGWRQKRLLRQIGLNYPISYPGIHPKSRRAFVALVDRGLIDAHNGGWDAATLTDAGRALFTALEAQTDA